MAMTNRGVHRRNNGWFRAQNVPTTFYVALCTSAVTPTVDTVTLGSLTQMATGNGYSDGGIAVARNTTDFDSLVENTTNDRSEIQIKDLVWTASGGNLPASGAGATWAVLTDDNGVVANRDVLAYWPLSGAPRTATVGNTITLTNLEMRDTTV